MFAVAQCTGSWSVCWFPAVLGEVIAGTFHTFGLVLAITLRVPILLATLTLDYKVLLMRFFNIDSCIAQCFNVEYVFVIQPRFQINKEEW
uniref:Uncharacterized protein n=1 Tax=Panstrongylus lignarius TaxID=156445 RepID=A0A224Y2A2_9HEMI